MVPQQGYVSVSRRPPDIEDYIDILRRYRSWIVGPTFAGLVIAVVVAFLWPDTFISTRGDAHHAATDFRAAGAQQHQHADGGTAAGHAAADREPHAAAGADSAALAESVSQGTPAQAHGRRHRPDAQGHQDHDFGHRRRAAAGRGSRRPSRSASHTPTGTRRRPWCGNWYPSSPRRPTISFASRPTPPRSF